MWYLEVFVRHSRRCYADRSRRVVDVVINSDDWVAIDMSNIVIFPLDTQLTVVVSGNVTCHCSRPLAFNTSNPLSLFESFPSVASSVFWSSCSIEGRSHCLIACRMSTVIRYSVLLSYSQKWYRPHNLRCTLCICLTKVIVQGRPRSVTKNSWP